MYYNIQGIIDKIFCKNANLRYPRRIHLTLQYLWPWHFQLLAIPVVPANPFELPVMIFQVALADHKGVKPPAVLHPRIAFIISVHQVFNWPCYFCVNIPCSVTQCSPKVSDQKIGQL